ncbi:SDR family oxidoreductase [Aquabacterium sp. OR-4]|uniref:SDR family oxidoreductase n=1 Tax=Aquabacterium sp. OR-4 TaxID=2978127 RepID=UPI0021B41A5B|nr:SDR family oxidoreductase [Aquabacterium sp. OR-4]MDT7837413.1 SDR family oxidoreductase [Aquabacterium sp. OR-4]
MSTPSSPSASRSQHPVNRPASRQVVLVTGAARRIGRQIALELAAAGWDLALHCHRSFAEAEATAAEVAAHGVRAEVFSADLADPQACETLVPAVLLRLGRLDAVVNNASLFEYDDPASFSPGLLDRAMRANTAPAVLLSRALHEHLLQRRAAGDASATGCVVNLLDQKLANPNPDYFSYTLSKAALQAATVMLAQACAPVLRVNAVSPGVTLLSGPMTQAEFAAAHRMTPLARSSTPDDVARAVRYLLEAPATTGHNLLVDGGQHLWGQPRDVLFLAQQQQAASSS